MYEIELKSLIFTGGKRCKFAGDIAEVVSCDEIMVVRLVDNPMSVLHNIFGVDHGGNLLWQIAPPVSFKLQQPYVSVTASCGRVEALNWDGHVVILHPKSGRILDEKFCGNDFGHRSRRTPSVRHWL